MKIPLAITNTRDKLIIYRNGLKEEVPFPIRPFALVEKNKFPDVLGQTEQWTKVPEYESKDYKRVLFDSTDELLEFKNKYEMLSDYFIANGILEQLYISCPDFVLDYPHVKDLKVLYFDIEVATKGDGFFPRPTNNVVLTIGYSIWLYKSDGNKIKLKMDVIDLYNDEVECDKNTISEFLDVLQKEDPDIIAGYNSDTFDLPYLIERAEINQLNINLFGRGDRPPTIKKDGVIIPGRIHFDVYNSNAGVIKDQTLFGLKDRKLKEVSRFYHAKNDKGIPIDDVELQDDIENMVRLYKTNKQRLIAYQIDDIYRTEYVGNVYIRNCITLAERIKVPLNSIIKMYSSFVPKIIIARHFEEERLINTETNFSKYNFQNGSVAKVGMKFEGALVGLLKDGLFDSTFKIDFSSMYPSSIQTFNIGVDTTKLVKTIRGPDKNYPGDQDWIGKFSVTKEGNYNWYRIPTSFDKKARQFDLIIRIRNDKDGFLKKEIAGLKLERKIIKKELAEAKIAKDEDKIATLYSQQNAIKVILNSIYGALALKSAKYGDMISAAAVTGTCRYVTGLVIDKFKENIIEIDTDGIILDKRVDKDEVNAWLNKTIKETFLIDDNYMLMDADEFGRSWFYAMKNYVVQEDEKLVIHGSSLKASRYSKIEDRARDLALEHIFNNKPVEEVLKEAFDFSNCTLEDFTKRVKLKRETKEYDDETAMQVFLAEQIKLKTKQVMTAGETMSYVVTKNKLPYKEFADFYKKGWYYTYIGYVKDISEINYAYYNELVEKKLEIFGIRKNEQLTLDLGIPIPSKKRKSK